MIKFWFGPLGFPYYYPFYQGSNSHVFLLLELGSDVVHMEGVVHLLQGLLVLLDQVQVVVRVYHQLGIVLWILGVLLIIGVRVRIRRVRI